MAKHKFSIEIRQFLETRAKGRCEYCKAPVVFMPHPFTIDHILPVSANGTDDIDNLAYACFGCNRCKHNKFLAVDPFSQLEVNLFNPRTQYWIEHFRWDASCLRILGVTAIGRATVATLQLNRPNLIRMRKELIEVNRHPPLDN